MKFAQVLSLLIAILFVQILTCETGSTYGSRQANRKQQKLIEGSMDLQADPCEDFYQYACGKWTDLNTEAGDKYHETISLLDYNANKELARLFNRFNLRNKPTFVKKAYEFYKSCNDLENYEPIKYLKWMKENENIKWPTLGVPPAMPVEFDWIRTVAIMRQYGLNNIFIEEIVMQRRDDPAKFIIDLDKPVTDGGFTALTYDNFKLIYETIIPTMSRAQSIRLWLEIKKFEEKLEKLGDIADIAAEEDEEDTKKAEEENKKDSRLFQIRELPLDWLRDYLKVILNRSELSPNMEIYIQNIPYMMALDKLIKEHTPRFICKYLEIRFLWHLQIQGPTNLIAEDCASNVRSYLPMPMYWLYEQQHPELQLEFPKITELYENIRKHFNKTILKNDHGFNKTVVDYLLAKINNMQMKINNIPRIETIKTLENLFENITLDKNDFYGNHLKLLKFNFKINHDQLNNSLVQREFFYYESFDTASSSSPYFIQRSNTVIVPLTLLQQPIYHPDLDDVYKYSSLGFLLAHEIIHGFDNTGLEIDHKGKMVSTHYDAIVANPLFVARFNCLLELNPSVIDEKIADVSGLRYAYQVFNNTSPDAFTKTRRVYGMDVSAGKLFFLNFAQFFCGSLNSEEFVVMSDHGTDRERVIDALTHFPEFSKTFQCSSSDRMHPHETCHIWRR